MSDDTRTAFITIILIALAWGIVFIFASKADADPMPEPPLRMLMKMEVDELPGQATLYYNLDKDKRYDLVYSHTIESVTPTPACFPPRRNKKFIYITVGCDAKPLLYILNRRIEHVRGFDERFISTARLLWMRMFACAGSW